jgi:hypothetical protein
MLPPSTLSSSFNFVRLVDANFTRRHFTPFAMGTGAVAKIVARGIAERLRCAAWLE